MGLGDEVACRLGPRLWAFDGEELPRVGDAFERMGAAIGECDARATDEVGHGAGDENFVGLGECLDPLGDVDGDATDVVTTQFDLTGVETNPHLNTDRADSVADSRGAAYGSSRPVKGRQEPVASRTTTEAATAIEEAVHDGV
jgi:hypothetical protein